MDVWRIAIEPNVVSDLQPLIHHPVLWFGVYGVVNGSEKDTVRFAGSCGFSKPWHGACDGDTF